MKFWLSGKGTFRSTPIKFVFDNEQFVLSLGADFQYLPQSSASVILVVHPRHAPEAGDLCATPRSNTDLSLLRSRDYEEFGEDRSRRMLEKKRGCRGGRRAYNLARRMNIGRRHRINDFCLADCLGRGSEKVLGSRGNLRGLQRLEISWILHFWRGNGGD